MKPMSLIVAAVMFAFGASLHAKDAPGADGVRVMTNVAYKEGDALTPYERDRCKLDVYLPGEGKGFATLVWFHGGGLKAGDKGMVSGKDGEPKVAGIARSLATSGIAVVAANYRLSPKVTFPAYIEDAAAAVAWAHAHIAELGGDPRKVFIGGHSAGGYLTLMLGMDTHYLSDAGVRPSDIAGLIPVSGQTMNHYTVREERGEARSAITADAAAPVHFARPDSPPFLVLYGDHDMAARAEENAYFVALLKGVGNKGVAGVMIADRTHGSIMSNMVHADDPGRVAILRFMRENVSGR